MMAHTPVRKCVKDLAEGQGRSAGTLPPAGPGPSVPRPSPVLLCQLHHHGRELVEHEDPGKPLIAHQPVGDLLMSGHRELIRPQHLAQEGRLGQGQVCEPAPSPAAPAPAPAPGVAVPRLCGGESKAPVLESNTAGPGDHLHALSQPDHPRFPSSHQLFPGYQSQLHMVDPLSGGE